MINQQRVSKSC